MRRLVMAVFLCVPGIAPAQTTGQPDAGAAVLGEPPPNTIEFSVDEPAVTARPADDVEREPLLPERYTAPANSERPTPLRDDPPAPRRRGACAGCNAETNASGFALIAVALSRRRRRART